MLVHTETKKLLISGTNAYYVGLPTQSWSGKIYYPIYNFNGVLQCTCYDSDTADNLCELLNHRDVVDEFEVDELRDEVCGLELERDDLSDQLSDLQKDYDKLDDEAEGLKLKIAELEKVIERARNGNLFPTLD